METRDDSSRETVVCDDHTKIICMDDNKWFAADVWAQQQHSGGDDNSNDCSDISAYVEQQQEWMF